MAQQTHDDIQERLDEECSKFKGQVRVKLWEFHKAWVMHEGRGSSAVSVLADKQCVKLFPTMTG
jgi:hypothetical protein